MLEWGGLMLKEAQTHTHTHWDLTLTQKQMATKTYVFAGRKVQVHGFTRHFTPAADKSKTMQNPHATLTRGVGGPPPPDHHQFRSGATPMQLAQGTAMDAYYAFAFYTAFTSTRKKTGGYLVRQTDWQSAIGGGLSLIILFHNRADSNTRRACYPFIFNKTWPWCTKTWFLQVASRPYFLPKLLHLFLSFLPPNKVSLSLPLHSIKRNQHNLYTLWMNESDT